MMGRWTTEGFEEFRRGVFGNAGHNLYVSREGVLQRIHQFDFNGDGYLDLVFCNSQNHWERPPLYVFNDPFSGAAPVELPAEGALSGAVADLNGDGWDDIVVGNYHNGISTNMNAIIYYGSETGWSERREQFLPAPRCTSVAVGDFNGDGLPDLAMLCDKKVRIFYQTELGFEQKRFVDTSIEGVQLVSDDLDNDGCSELIVQDEEGGKFVYWGSPGGIDSDKRDRVPLPEDVRKKEDNPSGEIRTAEHVRDARPLVRVISLDGSKHIFAAGEQSSSLVPFSQNRDFGDPITFHCKNALSVAVGDVDGDGQQDLVFACRDTDDEGESSWIYWGSGDGFHEEERTPLRSQRACDLVLGDLKATGRDDIVICQCHTEKWFSTESLIYSFGPDRRIGAPLKLITHDARRVFLTDTASRAKKSLVFINFRQRDKVGDVDVSVYFGGQDGFHPENKLNLPGWGAVEAVSCDINDDGYPDLILANSAHNSPSLDPGSYVYLNGPDGFPGEPSIILPTRMAHGVGCADLNRDGYLDLIFSDAEHAELRLLFGSNTGFGRDNVKRISLEKDGYLFSGPLYVYLADLNADGWLDIVVPCCRSDRSLVLWGGPDGYSMDRCQALSVWRGTCARAADLSGNGYLDLVIGGAMPALDAPHDSFLWVYWNGPEGLTHENRTLLPVNDCNAFSIADFDNDGFLDLFACCYHNGKERDIESYIYWNRGERGFSTWDRTRLFTHSAHGSVAADFNEDGFVDLAVANHKVEGDHAGWSSVWWNGQEGFSEDRVTRLPTEGPHGMTSLHPGSILDRGPDEVYVSAPFDLSREGRVTSLSWEADVPAKCWVKAQMRSAPSREVLEDCPWRGPDGSSEWFDKPQSVGGEVFPGRWVQYKLVLGSKNSLSTPRVSKVTVEYTCP